VFLNLYVLTPAEFRDFNYFDTLDRFETIPNEYFRNRVRESYLEEGRGAIEPAFLDGMRLTLGHGARQAFYRAHPTFPATERDYYLSKLFQFVYVVLDVRYGLTEKPPWEVRIQIEAALDSNQDWLPEATGMPEVDWGAFYHDTRRFDLQTVLKRLPRHVDRSSGSQGPTPKGAKEVSAGRRRGPKSDMARHLKIAGIVNKNGPDWRATEALDEICIALDKNKIRVPRNWLPWAQSWARAVEKKKFVVIKVLQYSLEKCV
jgi:hypothetical protein